MVLSFHYKHFNWNHGLRMREFSFIMLLYFHRIELIHQPTMLFKTCGSIGWRSWPARTSINHERKDQYEFVLQINEIMLRFLVNIYLPALTSVAILHISVFSWSSGFVNSIANSLLRIWKSWTAASSIRPPSSIWPYVRPINW